MKTLYQEYRLFFIILTILIIGFLLWYFSNIVAYILVAVVVSILGQPIINLLEKFRYGKLKIPRVLNALISLLVIVSILVTFFIFFIPLAVKKASFLPSINKKALFKH